MKRVVLIALGSLAACGGAASMGSGAASPVITGDTCALHLDAASCRADAPRCAWYPNTRPCQVGEPCPAGWCSSASSGGGGTGGGGVVSAGCACPGAAGDVCVMEIGGPAIQVSPPITCAAVPESCSSASRCACIQDAALGTCTPSAQVTNLCVCDNGIR